MLYFYLPIIGYILKIIHNPWLFGNETLKNSSLNFKFSSRTTIKTLYKLYCIYKFHK